MPRIIIIWIWLFNDIRDQRGGIGPFQILRPKLHPPQNPRSRGGPVYRCLQVDHQRARSGHSREAVAHISQTGQVYHEDTNGWLHWSRQRRAQFCTYSVLRAWYLLRRHPRGYWVCRVCNLDPVHTGLPSVLLYSREPPLLHFRVPKHMLLPNNHPDLFSPSPACLRSRQDRKPFALPRIQVFFNLKVG